MAATIQLSDATKMFLRSLQQIPADKVVSPGQEIDVSEAVSFMGFVYEKLRNAVEFYEEHLIRRFAIHRILKRRLAINPKALGEGENTVRELMWGRYISARNIGEEDIEKVQNIIDTYIAFQKRAIQGKTSAEKILINKTILDFLACELEEKLHPSDTLMSRLELYYFYSIIVNKVEAEGLDEAQLQSLVYAASEKSLLKNDNGFIAFHMFVLKNGYISDNVEQLDDLAMIFLHEISKAHTLLKSKYLEKLTRLLAKETVPFKILFEITKQKPSEKAMTDTVALHKLVVEICERKYDQTAEKLRAAAQRSVIYIFFTKMLFILILEVPVSRFVYGSIDYFPIGVNLIFPPLLMASIVSFINPPTHKNTSRIQERIDHIIDANPQYEDAKIIVKKRDVTRRPTLVFIFSLVYIIIFSLSFAGLYMALGLLGFHFISKAIFIFFMSVVAFFGYRIRQTAKEHVLEAEKNMFVSFMTLLFLPFLQAGKIVSTEISRINLLILVFDTIIDAPFKFFIEVIEEWGKFVKARKEDLL